jgi:dihydroflavonol-4-reductase
MDVMNMKDKKLSESYWNETSTVSNNPYSYSKVAAEKLAWEICKAQSRWDLVTINPGMVLGPPLTLESSSGSLYLLENMYRGDNWMGCPDLHFPYVHVQEVAEAHVAAGENPSAKGRYIVAEDHTTGFLEIANFVRPIHRKPSSLPSRNVPKMIFYVVGVFIGTSKKWADRNLGISFDVDNTRSIKELGITYRPTQEVVKDHYESWLKEKGSA